MVSLVVSFYCVLITNMVRFLYGVLPAPEIERMIPMPRSTHSKRSSAIRADVLAARRSDQGTDPAILAQTDGVLGQPARRDPVADRAAFLRALQIGDDAAIEAAWPGASVTKQMLVDTVIVHHGGGEYAITGAGLAELAVGADQIDTREDLKDVGLLDEQVWPEPDIEPDQMPETEDGYLDSESDGYVDGLVIRASIGTTCACGCGAPVTPKRVFRQGHDQRLIGTLAQAAASGQEVGHDSGDMLVTGSAQTYGAKVLQPGGCAKLDAAIVRATHNAAGRKAKAVVDRFVQDHQAAKIPIEPESGPGLGDEVKVRVGRHVYFARVHGMNQSGKVTAVSYRTKAQPDTDNITEKFSILTD